MRPICKICGKYPVYRSKSLVDGSPKWSYRCYNCKRKPWLKYKKETCERCGFVPEHPSQLDVDHVDANRKNNSPENLKTLCANCHRLKSYMNQDYGKVLHSQ